MKRSQDYTIYFFDSTSTWEGLSKSAETVTVDQIQCALKCSNMREECVGLYYDQTHCILLAKVLLKTEGYDKLCSD